MSIDLNKQLMTKDLTMGHTYATFGAAWSVPLRQNERQAVIMLLVATFCRRTLEQNHKVMTCNRNVAHVTSQSANKNNRVTPK